MNIAEAALYQLVSDAIEREVSISDRVLKRIATAVVESLQGVAISVLAPTPKSLRAGDTVMIDMRPFTVTGVVRDGVAGLDVVVEHGE